MEQKKITINGTEYTLQKVMPREWMRIKDRIKNKYGVPSDEKLADEMLKHVVVDPKVKLDDFADSQEAEDVVQAATRFQRGIEDDEE